MCSMSSMSARGGGVGNKAMLIGQLHMPRKSLEREVADGLVCKHVCLGQCGGIQCPNDPT